jgi:hypothetical protein
MLLVGPPLLMAWKVGTDLSVNPQDWAAFGGFVSGTTGVILTGLGFGAVIFTLLSEQRQVQLSAQEAEALRLEQRLYRLLDTLADMLSGTELRSKRTGNVIARGRSAFRNFFKKKFQPIYEDIRADVAKSERLVVTEAFDELYRRHGSQFGHYFRTLYHCFLILDDESIDLQRKKAFADLIVCRLSKFELIMLMYNCLGSVGARKFKPLVERYRLLEHIDVHLVLDPRHFDYFENGAFARPKSQMVLEMAAHQDDESE